MVIPSGDIGKGQNVWQAMGGMEVGSIWGHGSYVAPDWSADWLHRECVFILNDWATATYQKDYDQIEPEQQAQLQKRLERLMRTNTFDPATQTITVDPVRARAFEANLRHYADVFGNGNADYAIPKGAQSDPDKLRQLAAFFFWTSWAASTNRPGADLSYTSNWPHEPLVSNRPTGEAVVWTGVSVIMLLAGIGAMVWWYASQTQERPTEPVPEADPIVGWKATPSQQATVKYFWVVAAMILVQILLGVVTAHYGVEGDGFYGIPLSKWLPYSVTRTWHLQLGVLVDCDGVAGRWPVHRAAGQRIGTEGPAARRQHPVRRPAGGRGRVDGRAVVEHPEPTLADAPPSTSDTRATSTSTWAGSGRSASSSACCSGCFWSCEWSFRP